MGDRHNALRGRRFKELTALYLRMGGLSVEERTYVKPSDMLADPNNVQVSDMVIGPGLWSVSANAGRSHDLARYSRDAKSDAELDGCRWAASTMYKFNPATVADQYVLLDLLTFREIVGIVQKAVSA